MGMLADLGMVVFVVFMFGAPVAMAVWYRRRCGARINAGLRAFEPAVLELARRYGLGFKPIRAQPELPLLGQRLEPPVAAGPVGRFAVEIGVSGYKLNRNSYVRLCPLVPLDGWPAAVIGHELHRPPPGGHEALAQLRALGYRAYVRQDGVYIEPQQPMTLSHRVAIEDDAGRLARAVELALELAHAYPASSLPAAPGSGPGLGYGR